MSLGVRQPIVTHLHYLGPKVTHFLQSTLALEKTIQMSQIYSQMVATSPHSFPSISAAAWEPRITALGTLLVTPLARLNNETRILLPYSISTATLTKRHSDGILILLLSEQTTHLARHSQVFAS